MGSGPEMNSPWFSLFLYSKLNCGPPSLLLPLGTRLLHLPEIFQGYHLFMLTQFLHDSQIVPANNVLASLNDMLLVTPVLIQGYSRKDKDPKIIDVPLPLPLDAKRTDEVLDWNSENMKDNPIIHQIVEEFKLEQSIGFIRMMKCDFNDKHKWVALSVTFGMPLFDIPMNNYVCDAIATRKLFSNEALSYHSKSMRLLCLHFLHFIEEFTIDLPYELHPDRLPLPSTSICYHPSKGL